METKTNKALDEISVDLVRLLPEEILDVLIWYLVGWFDKQSKKEESIGESLTLRIQDNKEVTAAIEKI